MLEEICSNCRRWRYNRWTEEKYGMGVGVCGLDNSPQFCSHRCPFCEMRGETDE
jgi:wyosine [tRNA(Phe)-imidazoG37] synthetase (radical SAM superfamily)